MLYDFDVCFGKPGLDRLRVSVLVNVWVLWSSLTSKSLCSPIALSIRYWMPPVQEPYKKSRKRQKIPARIRSLSILWMSFFLVAWPCHYSTEPTIV